MSHSRIEWTESTWNPVTGCTKVSAGCLNRYAERMAKRLRAMGQENYRNGFEVTCHEHALELPLSWRKPQTIFVNSMSDLFHEDIPFDFVRGIFEVTTKPLQRSCSGRFLPRVRNARSRQSGLRGGSFSSR